MITGNESIRSKTNIQGGMKKGYDHIGKKVVIGYAALIVIAVFSLLYIYGVVRQIASEEDINSVPRQKIYLVTNTQTLLYESEAMGQLLNMEEEDFGHFNETLDRAHANMDSLRQLVTNDSLLLKMDTIDMLIERKRMNTEALMEIWKEANKDLYAKNIEKALASQVAPVEEKDVKEEHLSKKDTVVVTSQKRGFLKRLKEVFVPSDADSSVIISQNEKLLKDTQVSANDPNAAISKTLRNIQSNVASERERLRELLVNQSSALRYDNSLINARINQILRDMEEEEMGASLVRMQRRQDLLGRTAYLITGIALLSVFVIVFFLILIARDLFRSRFYRERLERAIDSREKLILTISHDVRAPLSSVIGYVELLQRSGMSEQQNRYLHNIGSSSRHILSLVNDLLDFQRLESGQMEAHKVPLRIPSFFNEITDSFQPQAKTKGLDFILTIENSTDKVYLGDSVRIRQIIGNLVNNAIKFTPEGKIELIVDCSQLSTGQETEESQAASNLIVTVRDSGPGIAKEQQQKIFGEFARLEGTEKVEGFGLGLSITNRLVNLLGGKLDLHSEIGKGSDFIVSLPMELAAEQDIQEVKEITATAPTALFAENSVKCLIVDDDLMQIALLEEMLRLNGIHPVSCTNPELVVDFLTRNKVDFVLSDIQMPGMDGFALIKQIRTSELPEAKTLPVVMLSGSVGKDTQYKEAGFTDSLGKPYSMEQLRELIMRILPEEKRKSDGKQNKETIQSANEGSKVKVNFSGLTKFAGEDKAASDAILQTFFSETRKNIEIFKDAEKTTDRVTVADVAHKLIPLFSMLEANVLVQQLQILQRNEPELTDSGWRRLVTDVIKQASSVIEMENHI